MKPLKLALRIWITITSLLSFLVGWALLSHAPKPASIFSSQTVSTVSNPASVDPLPTLAPIPSLDSILTNPNTTVNLQPLTSFSNSNATNNNFFPSFRTRGS